MRGSKPCLGGGGKRITHKEIEKEVIGHWTYGSPTSRLGIRPDGKAYHEKAVMTWTVNADKSVVLTDTGQPGKRAMLVFDSRVGRLRGRILTGGGLLGCGGTGSRGSGPGTSSRRMGW
jgi:hypothetical protein